MTKKFFATFFFVCVAMVPLQTNAASVNACTFRHTGVLKLGRYHADVELVQKVLNTNSDTQVSRVGAGSKGQETKYFGKATLAALAKFQAKYGITGEKGMLGTLTMTKMRELCLTPATGIPVNTSLPSIISSTSGGTAILTATVGEWTNQPTSFTYAWRNTGGTLLATSSSYKTKTTDQGSLIAVTVTATNEFGSVSAVSAVRAIGISDTVSPSTPIVSAQAVSSTQINLVWSTSTDNVGVTGYRLYRGGYLIATLASSVLRYQNTGLTPSTQYTYYVTAFDASGNISLPSATVSATTLVNVVATSTSTTNSTTTNATSTTTVSPSSPYTSSPAFGVIYNTVPAPGGGTVPGSVEFSIDTAVTLCDQNSQYSVDAGNSTTGYSTSLPVYPRAINTTITNGKRECFGYFTPFTYSVSGTYTAKLYKTSAQGKELVKTLLVTVSSTYQQSDLATITVIPQTGGTIASLYYKHIDCGSLCSAQFIMTPYANAPHVLLATPSTGYSFVSWGGDCTGSATSTCQLRIDGNKTVSAVFVPK